MQFRCQSHSNVFCQRLLRSHFRRMDYSCLRAGCKRRLVLQLFRQPHVVGVQQRDPLSGGFAHPMMRAAPGRRSAAGTPLRRESFAHKLGGPVLRAIVYDINLAGEAASWTSALWVRAGCTEAAL